MQTAVVPKKPKKGISKTKEVEQAAEKFRQALIDSDEKVLQRLLCGSLTYGHSDGFIEGKTAFISNIASGKYDFVSINSNNQSVAVFGKTAIIRHIIDADTNDNNIPGHVNLGIILVWLRKKGKWKLLARQAVRLTS